MIHVGLEGKNAKTDFQKMLTSMVKLKKFNFKVNINIFRFLENVDGTLNKLQIHEY